MTKPRKTTYVTGLIAALRYYLERDWPPVHHLVRYMIVGNKLVYRCQTCGTGFLDKQHRVHAVLTQDLPRPNV